MTRGYPSLLVNDMELCRLGDLQFSLLTACGSLLQVIFDPWACGNEMEVNNLSRRGDFIATKYMVWPVWGFKDLREIQIRELYVVGLYERKIKRERYSLCLLLIASLGGRQP